MKSISSIPTGSTSRSLKLLLSALWCSTVTLASLAAEMGAHAATFKKYPPKKIGL